MSMEELRDLSNKIEQEIVDRGLKQLHLENERCRVRNMVHDAIKKFNGECTIFEVEPTDDDHMHWVKIHFSGNGNLIGPGSLTNFARQFTELSKVLEEAMEYHGREKLIY